jgi:selT/selW/selH-like putative selenoprotein
VSVNKERFAQGLTYSAFRQQMTRNQERFDQTESTVELSADDVEYFKNLPKSLNVLVLAEDWCGDVINNLPVLGRLAAESGKLNVRIFLRDQNLDLMDQYLNQGLHRSIPVFVFFDENFNELGHWIERPARMSALTQEARAKYFASDPELAGFTPTSPAADLPEAARLRLTQALTAFRVEQRHFSDSEVIREIREIVSGKLQEAEVIPVAARGQVPQRPSSAPTGLPVKVAITYCADCGYEPQTLALTSALMMEFRGDLASIELIPWHDGMFDVAVDGDLVHSMAREGGFPENETILSAVRNRLGVAQPG